MILADTMIWADHIGHPNAQLFELLDAEKIVMHPYVIGELSLGNLPERSRFIAELSRLPRPPIAKHREVANLIESAKLHGTGIGYVDAHLVASTMLMANGRLWTLDKRLATVATRLGIAV